MRISHQKLIKQQFQARSQMERKMKSTETQTIRYQQLTNTQLVKQIKNKDKIIVSLKDSLKNQIQTDKQKLNMYREKLSEEIQHNQKAVKSFENITQTILQILKKYQFVDQATRESVVSIMRESKGPQRQLLNDQRINTSSEFSCIQQIVNQTNKLLQYLSKLTDQNVNFVLKLKSQLIKSKTQIQKLNSVNQIKKQFEQQIYLLRQEINSAVIQNKNLKNLLFENEQQKNKLLISINSIVDQQMIFKLNKLNPNELIQNIKKLSYRIKQLQIDKRKIYAQFIVQKESNHKNYQNLLQQFKVLKMQKKRLPMNQ